MHICQCCSHRSANCHVATETDHTHTHIKREKISPHTDDHSIKCSTAGQRQAANVSVTSLQHGFYTCWCSHFISVRLLILAAICRWEWSPDGQVQSSLTCRNRRKHRAPRTEIDLFGGEAMCTTFLFAFLSSGSHHLQVARRSSYVLHFFLLLFFGAVVHALGFGNGELGLNAPSRGKGKDFTPFSWALICFES
jgi:hypothetical protein